MTPNLEERRSWPRAVHCARMSASGLQCKTKSRIRLPHLEHEAAAPVPDWFCLVSNNARNKRGLCLDPGASLRGLPARRCRREIGAEMSCISPVCCSATGILHPHDAELLPYWWLLDQPRWSMQRRLHATALATGVTLVMIRRRRQDGRWSPASSSVPSY